MDIVKEIENASKLAYLADTGEDVSHELALNRARLSKIDVNADDLTQAVVYLTSLYALMLQRNSTADGARFELLCKTLNKNGVFSLDEIAKLADGLDKITNEEIKGSK